MNKMIIPLFLLSAALPVFAVTTKDLSHEYNLVFADFLREKLNTIKQDSLVEVYTKDGEKVVGIFGGYVEYDDAVFVRPLNAHGFFKETAYDVNQLEDV